MEPDSGSWEEYRYFILQTLKRIDETLKALNSTLQQHSIDIRLQAFKWGLLGSVPSALAAAIALYKALKP